MCIVKTLCNQITCACNKVLEHISLNMSRHHPVFSSIYYIFSPIGLKCLSTVYPFTKITAWRHPYPFVDPLSVSECLYLCHKYASHLWRPWQGSVALFLLKHLQIIVIINVLDLSSESDTVLTLSLSQYETKIQCMTIKCCFTGEAFTTLRSPMADLAQEIEY